MVGRTGNTPEVLPRYARLLGARGGRARLVTSAERVSTPTPTHDGKAILYRSDTGADENWSIYRVGLLARA